MFGKSKVNTTRNNYDASSAQQSSSATYSARPAAPEATSSISAGLSIVGKIVGNGRLAIAGRVEGEVHASTVQICDGAEVEGNIVAEELAIGGHVRGTIHANRVKLTSTAVVEGDIYHRSLAIEENAQFEGLSRRRENVLDAQSTVPAKVPQRQAVNGASDGLDPSQAQTVSMNGQGSGNGAADTLNP